MFTSKEYQQTGTRKWYKKLVYYMHQLAAAASPLLAPSQSFIIYKKQQVHGKHTSLSPQ
jgi:hypothetical protein